MTKPRRAAIYARTSTGRQDVDLQLEELRAVVRQRKHTLVGEFVDEGVSSGEATRPQLERLLEQARRGRLDVVLVWRFDRFARSTRELVTALDEFKALGVDFVSLREAVDTSTPTGRVAFAIFAAIAEFERELIRERVKAGVEKARRAGKRLGRPRRRIAQKLIDRAEALRAEGLSWNLVADQLEVPATTLRRAVKSPPKSPSE